MITTGAKLANGALAVQVRRAPKYDNRDSNAVVILALSGDELVTWVAAEDGTGTCWGHYFGRDLIRATDDFVTR